ncbi:HlyD family secretion protein [Nitrospirillum viridazoti]|uniref:Membrane fusion protein (Multidrug efflux system) n=1 Tax=Nitrospirillum amazonense TaxID=28077 RepID=A0A560HPX3_9PROT|nr:HlyD family secretion protein [Nitrospirillum amazonense]TWB47304.1 membrane fusion protein (multidrug efflux system) [Nitrospirillum amazonense]
MSGVVKKSSVKVLAGAVAAIALLGGAAVGGNYYWKTGRFLESTDDAYVQADYTTVAPKVSGYIAEVLVEDNQPVKAGQVLARIDDRDFRTALDQAKADVATAEADIRNIQAQRTQQQAVVAQAQAALAADQANLTFARQDRDRYRDLMKTGFGTVQRAQQTEAAVTDKASTLQRDQAALVAAQKQVDVLATAEAKAATVLDRAQAIARQAELNLSYTTIAAPIDGTVGARTLRVGQLVQAGTQLMAVVPLSQVYVLANFKETQLTEVRPGQPVQVTVDSFPGTTLKGRVDSLSPASGTSFALLPPDNATGNFTKIVQRIPIKIVLDEGQPLAGLLRPGMSAEPVIDTRVQPAHAAQAPQLATSTSGLYPMAR